MKIGMLHKTLPFSGVTRGGGVDHQIDALAGALVRRGHEVVVGSLDPAPPGARYAVERLEVPAAFRASKVLYQFGLGWYFRDFAGDRFDVLHTHGDDHFLGRRVPVLRTFYGSSLDEARRARSLRRRAACLLTVPLECLDALKAHHAVGISRATIRRLPGVGAVIPCGVDLDRFRPAGRRSDVPSILFVGALHDRKRGARLVEIFERIVRPAVGEAELWMVVADDPLPVAGVRWFRDLPTDDLVDLYRKAWLYCSPSSYEGFGIPYLEAMACRTPVVATPNPGALEVLAGGAHGLLVGLPDLGAALVDLLGDPAARDRLAAAGLARSADFSIDRVAGLYEDAYRVARRRAGR